MMMDGIQTDSRILKLRRYYTPNEVAAHNIPDDIWVSFLGRVYDLTKLCERNHGNPLLKPIVTAAGKDISHWFNPETKDIRTYVDPETGCVRPYTPHGRFLHVAPPHPDTNWINDFGKPWWRDELKYCVGYLSKKTQHIKIINTLTSQERVLEVCREETMHDILRRYLEFNKHAQSYTWKYDRRILDMDLTLAENRIADDDDDFYQLRMNDSFYLQSIHLYFNDDLTEA